MNWNISLKRLSRVQPGDGRWEVALREVEGEVRVLKNTVGTPGWKSGKRRRAVTQSVSSFDSARERA